MARRRLDTELVRRGLADSREQAQALIERHAVLVAGAVADKAGRLVADDDPVVVEDAGPRFVSRGGEKLDAALDRFGIEVAGKRALDAGSSTGGFTDCLLQRGALQVTAVDVGRGQLDERLRTDPRVVSLERTHIRDYRADDPFPVVVADLSFISRRSVVEPLVGANAASGADVVLLVKPQFEAGREVVSRGRGVVRDEDVWRDVVSDVASAFTEAQAARIGAMVSPLRGADGNVEFLLHLRAHAPEQDRPLDLEALLAEVAP